MEGPPRYIIVFLIASIISITAVLGVMLMLILLNQKRQRIFEETYTRMEAEHAAQLLSSQVEIHEQTLRAISQEIHDNISLSLTLAKLNLYKVEDTAAASQTLRLINEAIRDLSAISRSLNSDLISQQGLLKATQAEIERISQSTKLKIDFDITGEPVFFSADQELFLFRMVQEAFNNVLKHAAASTVRLHFHYAAGSIALSMEDNGQGFAPAALSGKKGISAGLQTMEKRVRQLGGEFSIASADGEGTRLFISFPFEACPEHV